MKKFLLVLLSLFMIISLAGCGPSAKEEAKQFDETYYVKGLTEEVYGGLADKINALFKNYPNNSATSPDSTEISSKFAAFIDKVKNVKIENKEVEPLKEALIKYTASYSNTLDSLMANEKPDVFGSKSNETLKSKFDYLNEKSKLETGHELSTMTIDDRKYYASTSSNVMFAIMYTAESDTVGSGHWAEKAQGKFISVKIGIYNNQKDAITVDSTSFHLVDKQGRQFSASSNGMSAVQLSEGHAKGFLTQLNPTMFLATTFVFDVPANTKLSDYKLEAKGGMTGDKILIKLQNQATGY